MGVEHARVGATVGASLHRHRVALGVSTARLAAAIGVRPADVECWERGEAIPSPARIRTMARVLGLDQATMLTWMADAIDAEAAVIGSAVGDPVDVVIDFASPDPFVVITDASRPVDVSVTPSRHAIEPRASRPPVLPRPVAWVFPAPAMSLETDRHVYSPAAGFPREAHPRLGAAIRMVRVATALAALGFALAWALDQLGHGLGDLLDMFGG